MRNNILQIICIVVLLFSGFNVSATLAEFNYFDGENFNNTVGPITLEAKDAKGNMLDPANLVGLTLNNGSYITVKFAGGNVINKIVIAFSKSGVSPLEISSDGEITVSTTKHTWIGNAVSQFTMTNKSTTKVIIKYIDIEYSESAAVDAPLFSLDGGVYDSPQQLDLFNVTEGATILYTTDGSIPSQKDGLPDGTTLIYSNKILIDKNMTIKAMAVKAGVASNIVSEDYIIAVANSAVTTSLNLYTFLVKYAPGSDHEPVLLKDITVADVSKSIEISFLSRDISFPLIHTSEELTLPPSAYMNLRMLQEGAVIEKVVVKMLKEGAGVRFLYINGEKKYISDETNTIEWTGNKAVNIEIENPPYESDGNTASITDLIITYRKAETITSISDLETLINNNTVGYFSLDQLTVVYHNEKDLYLSDNTKCIYSDSANVVGNRQLKNGDLISTPIVGKIPANITESIAVLSTIDVSGVGTEIPARLMTIKEAQNTENINSLVQLKYSTFESSSNTLSDNSGKIRVEQRYDNLLNGNQSYNLNGIIALTASNEYLFYPTEILNIVTGVEKIENTENPLKIIVQNGELLIDTPIKCTAIIYNYTAQKVLEIELQQGHNRHNLSLANDTYIVKVCSTAIPIVINN